jgi:hypothetical protein
VVELYPIPTYSADGRTALDDHTLSFELALGVVSQTPRLD